MAAVWSPAPTPSASKTRAGKVTRRFDVILITISCSSPKVCSGKAKIARLSAIRLLRRTRGQICGFRTCARIDKDLPETKE